MTLPIAGLHVLQHRKRKAATEAAKISRHPATCPREAHEAKVRAEALEEESAGLDKHIQSDEEMLQGIEHLIAYLINSPIKSDQRRLCREELESAGGRLRRELGDKPVSEVPPVSGQRKESAE